MRRRIQILGWTLTWLGVLVFGYVGWQLFVTDLLQSGAQAEAKEDLEVALVEARHEPPEVQQIDPADYIELPPDPEPREPLVFYNEEEPEPGEAFAFLRIPKIGVDEVLFSGVDRSTLRKGPGHMPWTPLPGQPGNSVLSGHRTTYGRPFFDLDQLEPGDLIEVETAIGTHVYEVREMLVVLPTDVWVTESRSGGWLTLTTCNPKFSARERLIVWAEMVSGPNFEYVELQQRLG